MSTVASSQGHSDLDDVCNDLNAKFCNDLDYKAYNDFDDKVCNDLHAKVCNDLHAKSCNLYNKSSNLGNSTLMANL